MVNIPRIFTRFLPIYCIVGTVTPTFRSISENSQKPYGLKP